MSMAKTEAATVGWKRRALRRLERYLSFEVLMGSLKVCV